MVWNAKGMTMSSLPTRGDIVTVSWEWNDEYAAQWMLKFLVKKISEGHLPDRLEARPITGMPNVSIDVTPKQQPKAYLDEEGRLEIIEQEVFV